MREQEEETVGFRELLGLCKEIKIPSTYTADILGQEME